MSKIICDKYQIGRNMLKARTNSGKTQVAASFVLGRSESTIAKVESGNRLPSLEMLYEYMDVFHVDANYLLGIETEDTIDAKLRQMDDTAKEYLTRIFSRMIDEFPTGEGK